MKMLSLAMTVVLCWFSVVLAGPAEQQALLRYYDGSEYLVSDFSFYTDHKGLGPGKQYFKSTKNETHPLLVKSGKLWYEVQAAFVTNIRLEANPNDKLLKATIQLSGNRMISGVVTTVVNDTWAYGENFWIGGTTTKFGNPAKFNVNLCDIASVESIDGLVKQFRIKTKQDKEIIANSLEFGLYGAMPYATPSQITLANSIELTSDGMNVAVPLRDIHSFRFDEKSKITMLMQNGESGTVSLGDVTRIYGRTKADEVIFDRIASPEGAKIKMIEFLKPARKTN